MRFVTYALARRVGPIHFTAAVFINQYRRDTPLEQIGVESTCTDMFERVTARGNIYFRMEGSN